MSKSISAHQRIYEDYYNRIIEGKLLPGSQLPTEVMIAEEYGVSRPTVTKALSRLQNARLIVRKAGSGSFVSNSVQETTASGKNIYFGLIIPRLGVTEIFEPICARIAQLSGEFDFHLLWGDSSAHGNTSVADDLEATCDRYIKKQVDGIFYVPLELIPDRERLNKNIIKKIKSAGIPLVLIDSDIVPFGQRSTYDLVGIDNVRAGYVAAEHYLEQGAERIDYVFRKYSAYTVDHRQKGIELALINHGITPQPQWRHCGNPNSSAFIKSVVASGASNIIFANDSTALDFMMGCYELGYRIPEDIRAIGFDDVRFVKYARVPLTTFHQPCAYLGDLAVQILQKRIEDPRHATMTALAEADFLVRESSIIPDQAILMR
ncbi:LacI family DNA-binding transcriptional regulator [Spirochaeta dissipatitropha]